MGIAELTRILSGYGADIEGVTRRFCGDMALYQKCVNDFMKIKEYGQLIDAMNSKNYDMAFASAHTLKGLSGNLGLTPLYTAVYKLVESLRKKEYGNIESEYEAVLIQWNDIQALLNDATV